jgi:hypothetical protein
MVSDEADGWGITHDRSALPPDGDSVTLYMVGPFPSKEVADLIEASMGCLCQRRVIPLFFPNGVTMMVTVPLPGIDTTTDGPVH